MLYILNMVAFVNQ